MLGDNVIKIRKERGLSLNLCAKKIGISPGYLSDIENNIKKNPSIEVLEKIASVLGIPAGELLNTEEKLELALCDLNTIKDTVSEYYASKDNVASIKELELDAETNLLIAKIKKLSNKDRKIVEVLVDQLMKEE